MIDSGIIRIVLLIFLFQVDGDGLSIAAPHFAIDKGPCVGQP